MVRADRDAKYTMRSPLLPVTSCSMRLRAQYSFRSSSMPLEPAGSLTKSWRKVGITDRADGPMPSGATGMARQPSRLRPSSATITSMAASTLALASSSTGTNATPTP